MVLKRHVGLSGEYLGCSFWCPGCETAHGFGPGWAFDGDLARPTVSPSLLSEGVDGEGLRQRCHLFIRSGGLEFLGDCSHGLAGQTVPMVAWPYE